MFSISQFISKVLVAILPASVKQEFLSRVGDENMNLILQVFGPRINRKPNLDNMPFDLTADKGLQFEHLAGLFASTSLDHAVAAMPVRQGAYLFGLARQMKAAKVIEIGRYKGGSTLLLGAAMNGDGKLWSIDIGEKEARMYQGEKTRSFDDQLRDVCSKFGLKNVDVIVGDSRTLEIETGEVDLVFIDGDHTYEGVKNDFERFGRRLRVGGALLFDDTFDEELFKTHTESVGRLVREILDEGYFKLVKGVNRLAHLERVR
jgi:predicted O-methyltransferase YrrM